MGVAKGCVLMLGFALLDRSAAFGRVATVVGIVARRPRVRVGINLAAFLHRSLSNLTEQQHVCRDKIVVHEEISARACFVTVSRH